jgi:hypothetical protein
MKSGTHIRKLKIPPVCKGCVKESINHTDHEISGGCLEGLQSIVYPHQKRPVSPPLDSIPVRTQLYVKKNIRIDIRPNTIQQVPCAMCLEFNIRDPDTGFFRTAIDNSIECEDHTQSLEHGYIPSIFTLYKNSSVHRASKEIEYTCGCNGCIRQALQYYSEFISNDNGGSSTNGYGFH